MRKQLTEPMIKKLRAPEIGRLEIFDSIISGLAVRITPNGAKSFVVRGRVKGRAEPIRVTIGDARGMKLSKAREEASDVLKACRAGNDPREERRLRQIATARADDLQFEHVVETFIEKHAKKNRSSGETESLFKYHVIPRWRGRLLTEIRRDDVVALLDRVEDKVSVYRANRVLAAIRKMFNWAVLRGLIASSPIVAGMAREGEESRTRYLTFDEIRIVWQAAGRLGQPFGSLFQFLLATGQRRGEATNALWKAFDVESERLWTLTPEEVKAGREHLVPLSDLAIEILTKLPRINDPATKEPVYVFTTAGSVPVSNGGKAKAQLDGEITQIMREEAIARGDDLNKVKPFPEWRTHDLRRTAATHLEDVLGIPPHIVGSVLNHSPRSYKGVTAVYTRGALIFERRRALTAWARLLKLAIGHEGGAAWRAIAKIMQPETEADTALTSEFRRMIAGDDATWAKYLKSVARATDSNVVRIAS